MPSPKALADLAKADQRMKEASQHLREYVERPGRTGDAEDRATHKRLVDAMNRAIADYWKAFDTARNEGA